MCSGVIDKDRVDHGRVGVREGFLETIHEHTGDGILDGHMRIVESCTKQFSQ
jgi:hypothetical protein